MVKVRWNDKEFEKKGLDPAIVRFLVKIGLMGAALAQVITDRVGAVDTGALLKSIAHEVDPRRLILRIGTNIKYAIYVFMGTFRMRARPILRMMLVELRINLK